MDVFVSQPCSELFMFFAMYKIHQHLFPPDTKFDDEWYIDAQNYIVNQDDSGMVGSNIKNNQVAPAVAGEAKDAVTVKVQPVLTDTESASQIELTNMKPQDSTPWKKQPPRQSTRRGNKAKQPKKRRQSIFEQMSDFHSQITSDQKEVKTQARPSRPPVGKKPKTRRKSVF